MCAIENCNRNVVDRKAASLNLFDPVTDSLGLARSAEQAFIDRVDDLLVRHSREADLVFSRPGQIAYR